MTAESGDARGTKASGRRARAVEGVIASQLPSGLYEVEIGGARITAHVEGGQERNFVRLLVGDRVVVEVAAGNATRGRIVRRT